MRSNFLGSRPVLRRVLPWALWGVAAAIGIPLAVRQAGIGSSPAVVETRTAMLATMRTAHRLRVARILVTPGQQVKAGDLLMQMDTSVIDADLAVARAKLAYVEIVAGWQQFRLLDDRTRTSHDLAATAERSALDVARIVAEAERDRSELGQLEVNLEAEQKLVDDKLANNERLKALKLHRAALSKKVDTYKDAVMRARKSAQGSTQRLGDWSKAADGKTGSGSSVGTSADARAAAGQWQRQEIARLEVERGLHELRAPFDGRIGEVLARVGDLSADPGTPLVTLVEEQSRTAIAYLSQRDATRVRVGDTVRLIPRDLSGPALTGRVSALAPDITEIPIRFRHTPTLHEFGRNAYIQLDAVATLPGQAFDAVFRHAPGSGT